jgi:uncharacterized integral membrane protein
MWLVRSVVAFLGVGAVLVFAISNVDQKVTRIVIFTRTFENISLNLVLLWAALLGAAVCFTVMILREFALRAALRGLRRENMRLDDELVALRNLPLAGLQNPAEGTRGRQSGGR